jgi:hypothetical protein
MSLSALRQLYRQAGDNEALKKRIEAAGVAVKKNPKFGSSQVGGNGYCYTCLIELAREGHYNCEECAKAQPSPIKAGKFDKYALQLKIEGLAENWSATDEVALQDRDLQKNAERIFR